MSRLAKQDSAICNNYYVETKLCLRCQCNLPVTDFSKHRGRPDGLQAYCKQCYRNANHVIRKRHAGKEQTAPVEKHCGQCGETKPSSAFYRDRHRPDGLYTNCRTCHRRNTDAWKAGNLGAARKISRASYRRNATKKRAAARARYWATREHRLAKQAAWKRENRARATALENVRRGRKAGAAGAASPVQIAARVAYYGGRCWLCRDPWQQIDHVKPISKGGSNWPANLRPACAPCNLAKNGRWPLDPQWRREGVGAAR